MAKKSRTVDLSFLGGEGERTDLSSMFAASVSELQQAIPVKIERLADNPYQPRTVMDEAGLEDLAQVIKAQGFQGVLVARPHPTQPGMYEITAGHRRREAARRAGLTAIPIVVRELADEEMVVLAITENIQREDLTPLEEGKLYVLMLQELGYKHEQLAREVGKNRGYIENRIRVARAPKDIQALVQAKPDSLRAVATLIKVKDPARRAEIIAAMLQGTLTADDLPGYIDAQDLPQTFTGRPELVEEAPRRQRSAPATSLAQLAGLDEQALARIGNGKLTAALRNLTNYRDALAATSHREISLREYTNLLAVRALAEELCEQWRPQEDVA